MRTIKPDNRSHVSGKTSVRKSAANQSPPALPAPARDNSGLPPPVARALKKLGADLALARRRRRLTQASMAERIQTSVATLRRMEHGDERIPIGVIAQACLVLGELDKINNLLDTASDDIGLTLMNQQLPLRVRRKKRVTPESGAL
ncbi:helix-turn-helix domain-containing protein [Paraburkholderia sartisoli]|uniref:Helix-turn-helix domain-containing protein n=1 Tax=Paraburkholderia sartisoli TaxID=83784 RepID=A0A1H4GI12_9BURK|nr:helix-turn-helix transcriptional regulator [Paraburkholderia sartisoli]SEB09249.1 Helix-turn-helix domain-containing protein [Paraburkholderia sartisoli]